MKETRMKPLDAIWLMMESEDTPMHVGALAIFQMPRNAPEDYLGQWAERVRESGEVVSPWNHRLSREGARSLSPRLVEDPEFDLDYHFRHSALPLPGGERELGIMVSRLHSHALDKTRPLWEFHLIEGLDGNRFAFYVKIHHSIVDNVNGIPMFLSMLSESAKAQDMPPLWARPLPHGKNEAEDDSDTGISVEPVRLLGTLAKATSDFFATMLKRKVDGSVLLPSGAPRSTLNREINSQRRFATQQFEQQRIQRLADATDTTLNVVLAYLCGSALRRFFKEYNALPDESLIGALPVSLQERSESLPGNAIAGLRVALGTHIGDPLARLESVKDSMQNVRRDRASLPDEAATSYVLLRAAPIYASQTPVVGRFIPPLFNLVISNTPGPDQPQYFNGARMEAIYPMGQLMQFTALSIGCVNYAGTLNIGFTGARDTLPHLQRMAVYMGKALADLEELVLATEGA